MADPYKRFTLPNTYIGTGVQQTLRKRTTQKKKQRGKKV